MQTVTLEEAKIHLTDLVNAAAAGEDIFILKDAKCFGSTRPARRQEAQASVRECQKHDFNGT